MARRTAYPTLPLGPPTHQSHQDTEYGSHTDNPDPVLRSPHDFSQRNSGLFYDTTAPTSDESRNRKSSAQNLHER